MADGLLANIGNANSYAEMRKLIDNKTAPENVAQGLVDATKDIPQNSFGGGLASGLASGYQLTTDAKADKKRDKVTEALLQQVQAQQVHNEQQQKYIDDFNMHKAAAETTKIIQDNINLSLDSFQSTGDVGMLNETLNNETAAPLRKLFESQITSKGGVYQGITGTPQGDLMPFGITADGQRVYGDAIPAEKGYSNGYLVAKHAKDLDIKKAELTNQKLEADANKTNAEADKTRHGANNVGADGQNPPKPLAPTALKLQNEELDALGTANNISADIGKVVQTIDGGKLKIGMFKNLESQAQNYTGHSTEDSRNYATFRATLEKMRNDSLRLNKGVQTEGDAVRAWNELFQNTNDPQVVKQRLQEIQKTNERAAQLRKLNIDNMRANYNQPPLDYSKYEQGSTILGNKSASSAPAATPTGSIQDGQTATNPQTGEKLVYRGGQWQKM